MRQRMVITGGVVALLVSGSLAVAVEPDNKLLTALIWKESRGNDHAVGDKNLPKKSWAYGPLQIRQVCVDDVNRAYRTHYRAEDCLGNRPLSVWICQKYLDLYATRRHLGHRPTDQDLARIWNGGPSGWKRSITLKYWRDVLRILKSK